MKIPYRVTDANRAFWDYLVRSAAEVAAWPAWKRDALGDYFGAPVRIWTDPGLRRDGRDPLQLGDLLGHGSAPALALGHDPVRGPADRD